MPPPGRAGAGRPRGVLTCGYLGGFLWRRAAGVGPGAVPWGPLVLSPCCLAALAASEFLGGKLAFGYGVRVADEATQAEGYRAAPAHSPTSGAGAAAPTEPPSVRS